MDADFLDVTEKGNKKILFVIIVIILAVLAFGYFFVFQKVHFSLKKVTVELGSEVSTDVNDYLTKKAVDTAGYTLNVKNVDSNTVGEYTYTVTYNKRSKTGKVEVKDTTPPVFTTKEVSVEAGDEDFYLGDMLATCEDVSKPCLVSLKNDSDHDKFATVGTYNIPIYVADVYNNKKEATVTVKVVETGTLVREEETDLVYASASVELENFNNEFYKKLEKAINIDSKEAEDYPAEISTTDWEEYVTTNYEGASLKNAEIIELFNKSGYIIGYALRLTINDGSEKQIFVTE